MGSAMWWFDNDKERVVICKSPLFRADHKECWGFIHVCLGDGATESGPLPANWDMIFCG